MQKLSCKKITLAAGLWIDFKGKCGRNSCNNVAVIWARVDGGLDQSDSCGGDEK